MRQVESDENICSNWSVPSKISAFRFVEQISGNMSKIDFSIQAEQTSVY